MALTLKYLVRTKAYELTKFRFLNQKGSSKKFPMSVATMSRKTKKDYLRLSAEKRRKK